MNIANNRKEIRFIDLFCGTGGFRIAAKIACREKNLQAKFVFASDIDADAQKIYSANFGESPQGDITQIKTETIPNHDVLLAGFPCQPFSICGDLKGFEDSRGTLFFDIARILEAKQPSAFILENVKQLKGHQEGKTLQRIIETLNNLGYSTDYQVLNALNFGLPQKRERIFIVGLKDRQSFIWPQQKFSMNLYQIFLNIQLLSITMLLREYDKIVLRKEQERSNITNLRYGMKIKEEILVLILTLVH
jgi:DNA (cytosine-5)-methyltransferase 1